ncbi:MAG: GTPase/DUF3482 domain-containing protein [Wenzhouxiangellaceae bacterium]
MLAPMSEMPFKLAVVGHTNVGKTSLMRTLLRDPSFGVVAPTAATTRQVERASIALAGREVVALYDTPGLEDAGEVLEWLERQPFERHQGLDRIREFLASDAAQGPLEQEARVLAQMLVSDAAVYVIDVREPVLGKYLDELHVLSLCARPILPLFNFMASPEAEPERWREALARLGMHAVVPFDTVIYAAGSERRLWESLIALAPDRRALFERLESDCVERSRQLRVAALRVVSELLIDAAGARRAVAPEAGDAALDQARSELHRAVHALEHETVRRLLTLYRFPEDLVEALPLPLDRSGWQPSLFDAELLRSLVRPATGGALAGAATGAVVDLGSGGLSLGAGTLGGLLLGSVGPGAWKLRGWLAERVRGRRVIALGDETLSHLAARAAALLDTLAERGHASVGRLQWQARIRPLWPGTRLPKALSQARLDRAGSALNGPPGAIREQLVEALAVELVGHDQSTAT